MDASDIAKLEAAQQYQDETDPTVRTGWSIATLGDLDWALSRIGDLETEQEELAATTEDAVRRIRLRAESINAKIERGISFFRSEAERYTTEHRADLLRGGKAKSRELPNGRVGFRKVGGHLKVVAPDELTMWALQTSPLLVRNPPPEPDIQAIKAYAASQDIIPPGMVMEPETERVYVKAEVPSEALTKRGDK